MTKLQETIQAINDSHRYCDYFKIEDIIRTVEGNYYVSDSPTTIRQYIRLLVKSGLVIRLYRTFYKERHWSRGFYAISDSVEKIPVDITLSDLKIHNVNYFMRIYKIKQLKKKIEKI